MRRHPRLDDVQRRHEDPVRAHRGSRRQALQKAVPLFRTAGDRKHIRRGARRSPHKDTVRALACEQGVPPGFALAIIDKESGFNNQARGRRGEIGASQILPATARAWGFDTGRLAREFAYNVGAGVATVKIDYYNAATGSLLLERQLMIAPGSFLGVYTPDDLPTPGTRATAVIRADAPSLAVIGNEVGPGVFMSYNAQ